MSVERAIVLGAPRSGTSFLMEVLDTLPDTECVSGNLMPVGIVHLAAQALPDGVGAQLQRSFRGAFVDYLESSAYRARGAALRKWWLTGHPPAGLARAAQGTRSETTLVYKEPFLAFAPQLAYGAIADGHLLYILRDGRDVADSLVRKFDVLSDAKLATLDTNELHIGRREGNLYVPWWVDETEQDEFLAASPFVRAIWMWREMARRCSDFFVEPDVARSGRVLGIRYEDLMRAPLEEGRRITTHLAQQPTRHTLRQLQRARTGSIGVYRRRSEREIDAAERVAGAELQAAGYPLSTAARS